jgi:DNA-binding MarR family transcriptional regulator
MGRRAGNEGVSTGRAALVASLGFHLGQAHRAVREIWEERLADLGLSGPQAVVLRAVGQGPACGVRELARRAGTDVANAKRLVDHLESAGLVRSTADPHHRQRRPLVLTSAGEALAAEVSRRAALWERELTSRLGPAEVAQLHQLLDQLLDRLGDQQLGGSQLDGGQQGTAPSKGGRS